MRWLIDFIVPKGDICFHRVCVMCASRTNQLPDFLHNNYIQHKYICIEYMVCSCDWPAVEFSIAMAERTELLLKWTFFHASGLYMVVHWKMGWGGLQGHIIWWVPCEWLHCYWDQKGWDWEIYDFGSSVSNMRPPVLVRDRQQSEITEGAVEYYGLNYAFVKQ